VSEHDPAPPAPALPSPAESLADQAATLRRIEASLERLVRAVVDLAGAARRG
jgi:hypothetical protein